MCKRLLVVAVLVSVLGSETLAHAASITVDINTHSDLFTTDLFQGFDPGLGTLDSVDVFLAASATFIYFNTSGDETLESVVASPFFSVTFADFNNLNLSASDFVQTLISTSEIAFLPTSAFSTLTTGLNIFESAGLISFSGTGSIDSALDGANSGPDVAAASPVTSLSGTVTYNYTPAGTAPVPEPASLTLLGLGLAGMAGRRWRQRKSS